jgi:hypothetical protein
MAPKVELRRIPTIPAFACPDDRGMEMARVSVEVPAELVGRLRETVLLLYQTTAESLHAALRARAGEEALDEIHAHRARLDELDELARRLRRGDEAVELSAPRELLYDTLYGALIDAGERLAETSNRSWRGGLALEPVQAGAEEALALDALLRALDR